MQERNFMNRYYGMPLPNPNSNDRYRFYTCELKWNHWECKKGFDVKMSENTMSSRIIPVHSWFPQFLDPILISFTLPNSVLIRPDPSQYTHRSWEEAPVRKAEESSG